MLRTPLHFHACLRTLKAEQQRGLKSSHDPSDGELLCGQAGSQVHRGAARGQVGETSMQAAHLYNSSAQWSHSHPSYLNGPLILFPLWLPLFTISVLSGYIKTHEPSYEAVFFILWNWIFKKSQNSQWIGFYTSFLVEHNVLSPLELICCRSIQ